MLVAVTVANGDGDTELDNVPVGDTLTDELVERDIVAVTETVDDADTDDIRDEDPVTLTDAVTVDEKEIVRLTPVLPETVEHTVSIIDALDTRDTDESADTVHGVCDPVPDCTVDCVDDAQ